MLNKVEFVIRNKLIFLENDELISKCLDKNILVSSLACEILVSRFNLDTNHNDETLLKVINKLSIEQVWELMSRHDNSKLSLLALEKLNKILEFYQNTNAYYDKVHENKKTKIYYLK